MTILCKKQECRLQIKLLLCELLVTLLSVIVSLKGNMEGNRVSFTQFTFPLPRINRPKITNIQRKAVLCATTREREELNQQWVLSSKQGIHMRSLRHISDQTFNVTKLNERYHGTRLSYCYAIQLHFLIYDQMFHIMNCLFLICFQKFASRTDKQFPTQIQWLT